MSYTIELSCNFLHYDENRLVLSKYLYQFVFSKTFVSHVADIGMLETEPDVEAYFRKIGRQPTSMRPYVFNKPL